jgi:hypothetical protein
MNKVSVPRLSGQSPIYQSRESHQSCLQFWALQGQLSRNAILMTLCKPVAIGRSYGIETLTVLAADLASRSRRLNWRQFSDTSPCLTGRA